MLTMMWTDSTLNIQEIGLDEAGMVGSGTTIAKANFHPQSQS